MAQPLVVCLGRFLLSILIGVTATWRLTSVIAEEKGVVARIRLADLKPKHANDDRLRGSTFINKSVFAARFTDSAFVWDADSKKTLERYETQPLPPLRNGRQFAIAGGHSNLALAKRDKDTPIWAMDLRNNLATLKQVSRLPQLSAAGYDPIVGWTVLDIFGHVYRQDEDHSLTRKFSLERRPGQRALAANGIFAVEFYHNQPLRVRHIGSDDAVFSTSLDSSPAYDLHGISADGRWVILTGHTSKSGIDFIHVVGPDAGKLRQILCVRGTRPILSPTGSYFAYAEQEMFTLLEVATGDVLAQWRTGAAGTCIAVSPDAKYLATTDHTEQVVVIWDVDEVLGIASNENADLASLEGDGASAYRAMRSLAASKVGIARLVELADKSIPEDADALKLLDKLQEDKITDAEQATVCINFPWIETLAMQAVNEGRLPIASLDKIRMDSRTQRAFLSIQRYIQFIGTTHSDPTAALEPIRRANPGPRLRSQLIAVGIH